MKAPKFDALTIFRIDVSFFFDRNMTTMAAKTSRCRIVKEHCRKSKSAGKRPCKKGASNGTVVKTHSVPKGCADDKVQRIQAAARGKAARSTKSKKLSSVKKLQDAARRMSKSKLRDAPTPPKTETVKISTSDLKLLTTYNRKDTYGKIMNPPAGTSKIVKKAIQTIIKAYDEHLLSEAARKQLVFLRIGHTPRLSMDDDFPPKSEFTHLLTFLTEQYESGGSNRAHWIVYNLASHASRKLRQRVVDSPLWEKFQGEMGDPTHWFQYLMTLVLIHRYDYVRLVFGSSFKDSDVEDLVARYKKDLKREEDRVQWWDSFIANGDRVPLKEEELRTLRKEVEDIKFNIKNAKRITQH